MLEVSHHCLEGVGIAKQQPVFFFFFIMNPANLCGSFSRCIPERLGLLLR